MVQLQILSGPKAGELQFVRRFPFHVGRAADNDLSLDVAGVWNYHFKLDREKKEGFTLQIFDEAFVTVNDQPQSAARLRNGDVISFGSVTIQFWLAPTRQRGLRLREGLVWTLIALVTALQMALIYCLIQ